MLRRDDLPHPRESSPDPARSGRLHTAGAVVWFDGVSSVVARGLSVLEAAHAGGVDLRSYCGGNCSCGTCRVEIVRGGKNLSPMQGTEEFVLGPDAVRRGDRLACQAQANGEVEVRVPDWF